MADEDDGKEYRWETGYEKTWYNLITFFMLILLQFILKWQYRASYVNTVTKFKNGIL